MRVLMRSHTVEDMVHDFAQITSPMLAVFEPGVDSLRNIFTLLGLTLDEQRVNADEFRSLLHGAPGVSQAQSGASAGSPLADLCNAVLRADVPASKEKSVEPLLCAGFRQLSLTKILTWTHFRDKILEQGEQQTQHAFPWQLPGRQLLKPELLGPTSGLQKRWHSLAGVLTTSKRMLSDRSRRSTDSSSSDECGQGTAANHGSADGVDVVQIVKQLKLLYQWMFEAFSALDVQNMNAINIAMDGPIIRNALASGDLEQLWQALISEANAVQEIDVDKFMKVFVKWVGIEDTWAVVAGLKRSRSRMMAGALVHATQCYPSKMGYRSESLK